MAEPTTSTTGITISVGTVSVVGTLLGMNYDSLLFGLFGGLLMLSRGAVASRLAAFSALASSTLFAGVGSPIAAAFAVSYFSPLAALGHDIVRCAAALAIGCGWQAGIPAIWQIIRAYTPGGGK